MSHHGSATLSLRTIAARFLPDERLEEILGILPVCPLSFECVWQEVTERGATSFPVIVTNPQALGSRDRVE
ncbi:unnamed protein product, partial [Ectocarpus sp. 13 AM-2016]